MNLVVVLCPGMLKGLLDDTLEVHDLGVELLAHKEKAGLPMEETLGYVAFSKFYGASKKLAQTSLAELKEEGLETNFTAGDSPHSNHFHLEGYKVGGQHVPFINHTPCQ